MSAESKGIPIKGIFSKLYDHYNKWGGYGETFRKEIVNQAALKPGESVLDCGCGTGTLAIIAKRQVGGGRVHGIDLSPDQLKIAKRKAQKEGPGLEFHEGSVDELPFPDATFDAIFCTLMLHHLPRKVKSAAFQEMRRVLRPGGRIVIADFGPPKHIWGLILFAPFVLMFLAVSNTRDNLLNRVPELMSAAGLRITEHKIIKEVAHLIKAS